MGYDEKEFNKLANKLVLIVWIIINSILSIAYAIEVQGNKKTMDFYVVFLVLAWIPVLIGIITLKIGGMQTRVFRDVIAFGYGIFFTYVLFTAETAITFSYVFPVAGMMILYKNKALLLRIEVANILILIANLVYVLVNDRQTARTMPDFEVQLACTILCYFSPNYS